MGKSVIEECTSDKCSTNVIHQDRIDYAKGRLP